jgi:very-short-patch-repair endonuclease
MPSLSCKHCNKLFTDLLLKDMQKANHVRWCDPNVNRSNEKFHPMCSCITCHKELSVQNLNAHANTHFPKSFKNSCLSCGEGTDTKFCSRSCSVTFNNKNPKNNRKFGPQKGYVNPNLILKPKLSKTCVICNLSHYRQGKTCSPACKGTLLSTSISNAIASGRHNPINNRGRGKQSYLEKSFQEWLIQYNVEHITEQPFKRIDKVKTYFADFYFPTLNLIIELDGTQHLKTVEYDQDRDAYITSTYGVRIIRVSHKEYISKTRVDEIKQLLNIA